MPTYDCHYIILEIKMFYEKNEGNDSDLYIAENISSVEYSGQVPGIYSWAQLSISAHIIRKPLK